MSEKYIIPTPGDVIAGKYHIEEELGRGAYGVVFRAHQTGIARKVALKTLLPKAFLETDIVERFEREAQFVGRLNHPNIVGVHDYGRHENLLYMAVEYVEGATLDEIIANQGPLEPDRVRKLVYQLVDALEHAHDTGIVHRDLKPANIVILPQKDPETGEEREVVKVLDFGIAKLIQTETEDDNYETLTQAGTVLGTPHYMSPETIVGDMIDHRADIYSLGVIMYEMLTGERPFGAKNSPGVMVKHLRDKPPALPAYLERSCWGEAVRGCMEKRPEKRIASATKVRDILERRDEGAYRAAVDDGATETLEAHQSESSGRKALLAAIGIGVIAAVGIAVGLQLFPGADDHSPPAVDQPAVAETVADKETGPREAAPNVAAQEEPTEMQFEPDETAAEVESDAGDSPPLVADRGDEIGEPADSKAPADRPKPDERAPAEKAESKKADTAAKPDETAQEKVTLQIETVPSGARVIIADKPVGSSPVTYSLEHADKPVTLELSLIGYRTKYKTVVPDKDQQIRVELEKGRLKLIP